LLFPSSAWSQSMKSRLRYHLT